MVVPLLLKGCAVPVECICEQLMKEPKVRGLVNIECMQCFKSCEERAPSASKLGADLNPEAFNTRISCGTTCR